jgi:pimeloyl-ACP methyl ester carboxylesterase
MSTVVAPDGATITVESYGSGPGVVVVHGGAVSAKLYRRFAAALADRCTVHLFNRRGRPGGAELPASGYTVQVDIDDIGAVLRHTGATRLFGHSVGGFIALQAALVLPVEKLALYDAAVQVDGLFPTAHLDDFEAAVRAKNYPLALAVVGRGLRSAGALSDLPLPVTKLMGKLFFRTPIGRDWLETLHTVPAEAREAANYGGPASLYASLSAETLLASGSRSPRYYAPINERLAAAIRKASTLRLPGAGHDGPNIARPSFMAPFREFLS